MHKTNILIEMLVKNNSNSVYKGCLFVFSQLCVAFLGVFVGCWIIVANRTEELNSGDPQTVTIKNVAIAFTVLFFIFLVLSLAIVWKDNICRFLGIGNKTSVVSKTPSVAKTAVAPKTTTTSTTSNLASRKPISTTSPIRSAVQPSPAIRRVNSNTNTSITINKSNSAMKSPISQPIGVRPLGVTRPTSSSVKPSVVKQIGSITPNAPKKTIRVVVANNVKVTH